MCWGVGVGVRVWLQAGGSGLQQWLEARVATPHPGPGLAGLVWARFWEPSGSCPYQTLANPLWLRCLQQVPELLPLQELGSTKEGFPRGLQSSREWEMKPLRMGQALVVPHLGEAWGLSWPLLGRCSSWGRHLPEGSVLGQWCGATTSFGTSCCWGCRTEVPQSCLSAAKASRQVKRCSH